jgi:hypothetical protein
VQLCKPLLTIPEAAELAQMSQRALRKVLHGLAKQEGNENLLIKSPGQRVYRIKREVLKAALGQDFQDKMDRHAKMLDDHERRLRRLEHDRLGHART